MAYLTGHHGRLANRTHPPYYDQEGNTFLPGYGRPLNDTTSYYPGLKPYPTALVQTDVDDGRTSDRIIGGRGPIAGCGFPITLREIMMQQLMDELTDKPEWQMKIFNEAITSKWKEEILASDEDVTEKMVEYLLDELKHKAQIFSKTGLVTVFDQGVIKSDTVVPEAFKVALQEAVKPLEDVPDEQKDWHPGSHEKVLDLVHPSLFPLVCGLSKVLPRGRMSIEEGLARSGGGEVVYAMKIASSSESNWRMPYQAEGWYNQNDAFSKKFQWLPCEVDIRGEKARITSYINNLHPKRHEDLYRLTEELIDYSIPLWEKALTSIEGPWGNVTADFVYYNAKYNFRRRVEINWGQMRPRIKYHTVKYSPDCHDPEGLEDSEDTFIYYNDYRQKPGQVLERPEPGVFTPFKPKNSVRIREMYKEHGLQVIVKLANIHLTPEKPEYEGGSWHVEGQLNEHIASTALYYYSNENITTSKLAFRQQCDFEPLTEIAYKQEDHGWLTHIYGLENQGAAVQDLGGVKTTEGRLIAFPNTLQHQVQPFKLADPTKPGHRKIIALFLVDPTFKIISTANVPSQRRDWWQERLGDSGALGKLPSELIDHVAQDVEFPYGIEKAKELRLELMEERKAFVVEHTNTLFKAPSKFSLCEH